MTQGIDADLFLNNNLQPETEKGAESKQPDSPYPSNPYTYSSNRKS